MVRDQKKEFFKRYDEVFDKDGNVKLCGRYKCAKLIYTSDQLEPEVKHGDTNKGFMNIESIKKLKSKLEGSGICARCDTGKRMVQLTPKDSICPYTVCNTGSSCGMFSPLIDKNTDANS